MLNINANGRSDEVVHGLAAGSNNTNTEQEKGIVEAFRSFIDEVKKIYGKNAIYYIYTLGNADHGGASFNVKLDITNYPDGIDDIASTPAVNNAPTVNKVVESPEDEIAKVHMDENGNQSVTPKAATVSTPTADGE